MKTFVINESTEILCHVYETRSTWGHIAKLMVNGLEVDRCKIRYHNRTWESFEFESVIYDLLTKTKVVPKEQIKELLEHWQKGNREEVLSNFRMIGTIAKLGALFTEDKKEQIDWKQRMIKAGLGESISLPSDWDDLDDGEKERRLDKVIEELSK
jgi:hypothetical protein